MNQQEDARTDQKPAPDKKLLEHYLSLLAYHRNAMEERRRIEIRTFVGIVVFFLVVVNGAIAIRADVQNLVCLKIILSILFLLAPWLFLGFLYQIEKRNWSNRDAYLKIEEKVHQVLEVPVPRSVDKRMPCTEWKQAWAATWLWGMVVALAIAAIAVVVWVL